MGAFVRPVDACAHVPALADSVPECEGRFAMLRLDGLRELSPQAAAELSRFPADRARGDVRQR